jgi:hypothetical protein
MKVAKKLRRYIKREVFASAPIRHRQRLKAWITVAF